jgi:hypothetical protein
MTDLMKDSANAATTSKPTTPPTTNAINFAGIPRPLGILSSILNEWLGER